MKRVRDFLFQRRHHLLLLLMVTLFSLADQVTIAGSAMATLQKELTSPSTLKKIIKPVKSPTPSRRAAVTREPLPPPFREAYAVSEEEFEEWEPQVGPMPSLLSPPPL